LWEKKERQKLIEATCCRSEEGNKTTGLFNEMAARGGLKAIGSGGATKFGGVGKKKDALASPGC